MDIVIDDSPLESQAYNFNFQSSNHSTTLPTIPTSSLQHNKENLHLELFKKFQPYNNNSTSEHLVSTSSTVVSPFVAASPPISSAYRPTPLVVHHPAVVNSNRKTIPKKHQSSSPPPVNEEVATTTNKKPKKEVVKQEWKTDVIIYDGTDEESLKLPTRSGKYCIYYFIIE